MARRASVVLALALLGCGDAASIVGGATLDAARDVSPSDARDATFEVPGDRPAIDAPSADAPEVVAPQDVVTADAFDAVTIDAPVDDLVAPVEDRPFVFPDLAPIGLDAPVDLGPEIPRIDAPPPPDVPAGMILPGPSRASAMVATPDDRIGLAVNRTADSVTVFALAPGLGPNLRRLAELPTGVGSDPWVALIDGDGDSAFVLLRRARQVLRVVDLRTGPRILPTRGSTGAEPTSIALSPTGAWLFVANFADGTVSVLDARTLATARTLDLNATLAATGSLGAGVAARPGLAHPRAMTVTNNGDASDADEALYVTEFFAQRRTSGVPTGLDRFDSDRQGYVYRVPLDTLTPAAMPIAPATDMGFRDSTNVVAGCFPNQLHAIAAASGRVYVTAVCASPRGPVGPVATAAGDAGVDGGVDAGPDAALDAALPALTPDPEGANLRTQHGAAIFVLDATNGVEIPARRVLLNARFQALYDTRRLPEDPASRRMPLIPIDLAFQPGTTTAYVAAYGADAVFRVRFNADGSLAEVGLAATPGFVDLDDGRVSPGRDPVGLALTGMSSGYVINEHTRNVSAFSLLTQTVLNTAVSSAPATGDDARRLEGRRAFVTGTGRWSWRGQSWNSCEACHPDGLSDNVTWYFPRGPRQTPSLDAVYARTAPQQRLLTWTASLDELGDFELNVRGNSGGVGAVVHRESDPPVVADRVVFDGTTPIAGQLATASPHDGLSGAIDTIATREGTATPRAVTDAWSALERYVRAIRPPSAPSTLDPTLVAAGRAIFTGQRCDGCHGGPLWTISSRFYTPSATNNTRTTGALQTRSFTIPAGFPTTVAPVAGAFRLTPYDVSNDQIACALRNVGTFAAGRGVAANDLNLLEVRSNASGTSAAMTVVAQGANGFNVPSLLGLAASAPYFHGGAARTLEELLSDTFRAHRESFSPGFAPSPTDLRALTAFLLSIDGTTTPFAIPARVNTATPFAPDLCAGF